MKNKSILIYIILLIIIAFLIPTVPMVITAFQIKGEILFALIGFTTALLVNSFFKRSDFWNTFWHELTHLFWAKLFRAQIGTIMVSNKKGGYVSHSDTFHWALPFVSLAPYFFPMVPIILIIFKFFIKSSYYHSIAFLVGFTLLLFYVDLIKTIKIPQPDILQNGIMFSTIIIFSMNIFFVLIIVSSMLSQITATRLFRYFLFFWSQKIF